MMHDKDIALSKENDGLIRKNMDHVPALSDIQKLTVAPQEPDGLTQKSLKNMVVEKAELDNSAQKAKINNFIATSKWLSVALFSMVASWLIIVGAIMIAEICVNPAHRLADSVLIALLSTTTANVLGLLYVVANYIFSPHHKI